MTLTPTPIPSSSATKYGEWSTAATAFPGRVRGFRLF